MNIVYLFPTNYKHGQPSEKCYKEIVSITAVCPRTQTFLNDVFQKTQLWRKFKNISFKPYVRWVDKGNDTFLAIPMIHIWYKDNYLKYFHIPTYYDVKFDFYILTSKSNNISNEKEYIIDYKIESSEYIITLELENSNMEYRQIKL